MFKVNSSMHQTKTKPLSHKMRAVTPSRMRLPPRCPSLRLLVHLQNRALPRPGQIRSSCILRSSGRTPTFSAARKRWQSCTQC